MHASGEFIYQCISLILLSSNSSAAANLSFSPFLSFSRRQMLKYPSLHLPLSPFWAHARSRKSAWVNHARKTNCASREGERGRENEREREEVWWTDADADTSAWRSSSVQIRWWERRVEGKKGRGGATLSCTGMEMTQGQYSQNHLFSPAPSLHIHQQRGEGALYPWQRQNSGG